MDLWNYILHALARLFQRGGNVDEPAAWFLVTVFLFALLLFTVFIGAAWAAETARQGQARGDKKAAHSGRLKGDANMNDAKSEIQNLRMLLNANFQSSTKLNDVQIAYSDSTRGLRRGDVEDRQQLLNSKNIL